MRVEISPIPTAIFPAMVGPAGELANPKLWQIAAPTNNPKIVIAESEFPAPAKINCRRGHPPKSAEPNPTSAMPKKFQVEFWNATG